jgi:DNA-damage-inducible protein J
MADTTNFTVRMDADIKKQCEALYGELGVNLTTAINVFLRQSLRAGGFPFDVTVANTNAVTKSALEESVRIESNPSTVRYHDAEEALIELKHDPGAVNAASRYYCPRCRAYQRMRVNAIKSNDIAINGTDFTIFTESYQCFVCNTFVKSEIKRMPVPKPVKADTDKPTEL